MKNNEYWKTQWITLPDSKREPDFPPLYDDGTPVEVPICAEKMGRGYRIRRDFFVDEKLEKAEIAVTAHGVYSLWIDGKRVGRYELTPEHTYYPNQLMYQVYDVTDMLMEGLHTIVVRMADGWYMGRIGFYGEDCQYGDELGLLLQLTLHYEDGTEKIIGTDEEFLYEPSAYVYSDLFVGEFFDERKYIKDFYFPGYKSKDLKNVTPIYKNNYNLIHQNDCHIEVLEIISAASIWNEEDSIIVDFGTVLAGRVVIEFVAEENRIIRIEHTEILDSAGKFMKNIKDPYKNQENIFICAGNKKTIYRPEFTYQGFRFVKITGLDIDELQSITAEILGSRMEKTGSFMCSDERLNQLQNNIYRSQMSNMISIPTDCPQREKAGWTGDVQVFIPTACFNQNIKVFMLRWLSDMRALQSKEGKIPIIIPDLKGYQRAFEGIDCSAGWSDAAVIVPWELYWEYGDIEILKDNYDMMYRWIMYIHRKAMMENPDNIGECSSERKEHLKYIWNTGFHFGDWLTPSASIDLETGTVNMMQSAFETMDIVPSLFYFYITDLMKNIAHILGRKEDTLFFSELKEKIRESFYYEYVDKNGYINTRFQGILVLALYFGILKEDDELTAVEFLCKLIEGNGGKMDTGFLSTPYILEVLWKYGKKELAYHLLLNEECPSWLYEVINGATSIWESWQAVMPDGRKNNLSMNHYATGCVGVWLYRHIAGLQCIEPGYKKIIISPDVTGPISHATGEHHTVRGTIYCSWIRIDQNIKMKVCVPNEVEALLNLKDFVEQTVVIEGSSEQFDWGDVRDGFLNLKEGEYSITAKINI